jgi:hypothetical protein
MEIYAAKEIKKRCFHRLVFATQLDIGKCLTVILFFTELTLLNSHYMHLNTRSQYIFEKKENE